MDRAFDCPPSCWLPEVNAYGQRRAGSYIKDVVTNQYAAKGHRYHRAFERAYMGARQADVESGIRPEEVNQLQGALALKPDISPIDSTFPLVEVECWYYPHTMYSEFGSTPEHEDPPPERCRGRCDLMGIAPSGMVAKRPNGEPIYISGMPIIVDYKTGNPAHQTAAKDSRQVRFFANWLAQLRPELCAKGVAVAVYLTRAGFLDVAYLPPDRLEEFSDALADLWSLFDLVDAGDATALLRPQSCKSKTSKWCSVECCRRNVQ